MKIQLFLIISTILIVILLLLCYNKFYKCRCCCDECEKEHFKITKTPEILPRYTPVIKPSSTTTKTTYNDQNIKKQISPRVSPIDGAKNPFYKHIPIKPTIKKDETILPSRIY